MVPVVPDNNTTEQVTDKNLYQGGTLLETWTKNNMNQEHFCLWFHLLEADQTKSKYWSHPALRGVKERTGHSGWVQHHQSCSSMEGYFVSPRWTQEWVVNLKQGCGVSLPHISLPGNGGWSSCTVCMCVSYKNSLPLTKGKRQRKRRKEEWR